MHTTVCLRGQGKSTGCHWGMQSLTKVTKDTCIDYWPFGFSTTNAAGLRILTYHPRRFRTFLKPSRGFCMALWLPCAFLIASAWLPGYEILHFNKIIICESGDLTSSEILNQRNSGGNLMALAFDKIASQPVEATQPSVAYDPGVLSHDPRLVSIGAQF